MNSHTIPPALNAQSKLQRFSFLLTLMLLLASIPVMADIRANLDRNTISIDDIFTLTIELDGRSSNATPDLSPLKTDFDVLGTSTRSQISIFNGQRNDKILWQIQLQAKHSGKLRIPPIEVNGQHTQPITINVHRETQQPSEQTKQHIFIENKLKNNDKTVYVQQQVLYSILLYYDDSLRNGDLENPELENAAIERIGEDKRYDTIRNGRRYHVIRRNYLISAEKSGELTIPAAHFRGHVAVPQTQRHGQRPGSLMDEFLSNTPFANDPFFRGHFGSNLFSDPFTTTEKPVSISGHAIVLKVKSLPDMADNPWLPAEAVKLSDSWTENPPPFRVGEPVSRHITIEARGISASRIPELHIDAPAGTRIYKENSEQENHIDDNTVYSKITRILTYIPNTQGPLKIPPITIKWWNTINDKPDITTLPAWQFIVKPGASVSGNKTPTASSPSSAPQSSPVTAAGAQKDVSTMPDTPHETTKKYWIWFIIISGVLLPALVLFYFLKQSLNRFTTNKPRIMMNENGIQSNLRQRKNSNIKGVLKDLQQACAANDRQAAKHALMDLAEIYWPDDPPRSLGSLAARIENGRSAIQELDRSLYAAGNTEWDGTTLWNVFQHGLREKKSAPRRQKNELNPLYPGY